MADKEARMGSGRYSSVIMKVPMRKLVVGRHFTTVRHLITTYNLLSRTEDKNGVVAALCG